MEIKENKIESWTPINLIDFEVEIIEYEKERENKFYLKKINNPFTFMHFGYYGMKENSIITPEFDTKRELYKHILENYKKINKKENK